MSSPIVFVCGATGTQGGAVSRALRSKDIEVHALARDPTSKNAKDLEALGVKLWPGDYDNLEALDSALKGCTSAFLNFMPDFRDSSSEKRHANNILIAAKNAGVKHVAYASGPHFDELAKLEHWDPESAMAAFLKSKQGIEQLCRDAGFQYWTIFRPGNFMANFLNPLVRMYHPLAETGVWTTALQPQAQLPMVATASIGNFAAATFIDPERFNGQDVGIVDKLVRVEEAMEKLSKAAGKELRAVYMSDEEAYKLKATSPFVVGQLVMRNFAKLFDMEKIRSWGVPAITFDEFLEAEKERIEETYQKVPVA